MNSLAFIIEDDPALSEIFTVALEEAGYTVEALMDGETAMARLALSTPAVIILDLHLPYVSGETIFHFIHGEKRLQSAWLVLATADFRRADLFQGKADWVLLKPISFTQLRDLTHRLLANPKDPTD